MPAPMPADAVLFLHGKTAPCSECSSRLTPAQRPAVTCSPACARARTRRLRLAQLDNLTTDPRGN
jgi:hypothetical protein